VIEPIDVRDLALTWWRTLAEGCVRGERVRPARGLGRRLHLWPATQILHAGVMVEGLLGPAERAAHAAVVDVLTRGLGWYRSGEAWGPRRDRRPRYADDVAWVGLALAEIARVRGSPLPDDAHRALAFVRSCEHPHGGVRWHEDADTRHTCSTAPAAHLALSIHRETGDPEALAFARRSLTWLDEHLLRPDGLYGDHLGTSIDDTVWAYNQGEPAAVHAVLDPATPPRAAIAWLADPDVLWREPQVFVAIGVRDLIGLDPSGRLHEAALRHLDRVAREGLAPDGFPRDGGPGRYGDDAAIDLAGLVQVAAALAAADPRRGNLRP
jgi:hypothetical protein